MKQTPPSTKPVHDKWLITIWGDHQIQNELLSMWLLHEMENCNVYLEENAPLSIKSNEIYLKHLLAIDCAGKERTTISDVISRAKKEEDLSLIIILFNVDSTLADQIESDAIEIGIHGIFYNRDNRDCFLKGIKKIFNGELWFSRRAMFNMLKNKKLNGSANSPESGLLTSREKEIIQWVVKGRKNREIAEALHVSEHTIKTHIYNIYKKIEVPNRFQAALWVSQNLAIFSPSTAYSK